MNGELVLDRDASMWRVKARPDVIMRLKRVFAKLSSRMFGEIPLSDTEENARDLEWFESRYPMRMTRDDRAYLTERAQAHRERTSIVEQMLSRVAPARDFDLAIPPREYQKFAAQLALANESLLLGDDVGVGKTVSLICMLADARTRPALIVTLTHLPKQWQREIARFAPNLRTHVLKSGTPYDLTRLEPRRKKDQESLPSALPDVIITSYSKLAAWADILAPIVTGHMVGFDEVQELRNSGGNGREVPKKYAAARHIARVARWRIGASATPIYNYGGEFWSVLDVLRPGGVGTRGEFVREWCGDSYSHGGEISDPKAFGEYMRSSGLLLRRTRADVGRELPPVTKIPHHIEADTKALDAVSEACAELARIILAQGEAQKGDKMHAAEELSNKLRQATGIAKAPYAAEFIRMLVESGERVLVGAWHREVYSIICDKLADLNPVLYTGTESTAAKDEAKQKFVKGESKVMLMSLRSGAGLDGLQFCCRTVVYAELDWSPAVHEQFTGRVARDGQPDPVAVYYLISDHGADPIMQDVLGVKRAQLDGVRGVDENFERLEVDGARVRKLAEHYLAQRATTQEDAA